MKTKVAGKVLAGIIFVLCCGLEAHAQSSGQTGVEFDNFNTAALPKSSLAGGGSLKEDAKYKYLKIHRVYDFRVLLNSGTEKEIRGRIKYNKEDATYTLVSKNEELKASDTKYIYRLDKASGDTITGTSFQNCWLFPVIRGRINGYSTYAENSAGYVTHLNRHGSKQLQAFDTRRKHAREQTVEMLAEMITGNEAAEQLMSEHLQKARKKELIKNVAIGGLGFVALGVAAAPFATAFVVGAPVGLGAGLATVSVNTVDLLEVIHVYNSTRAIAFF